MLRNILTVVSLLLLTAHELRGGNTVIAGCWLIATALPFVPWRWKNLPLAVMLAFGTWLWAETAFHLAQQRLHLGLPWLRLAAILGSVTLLSLTAFLLNLLQVYRTKNS